MYSSTLDSKLYSPALKQLEAAIKMLPAPKAKPKPTRSMRTIEIPVPSSAKADTFANLDGKFKVTLEYPGMLQVAETSTVSCAEWLAMLDSIENSSIGRTKQSPVSRLFYLQSADKTASAILGSGTGTGSRAAETRRAIRRRKWRAGGKGRNERRVRKQQPGCLGLQYSRFLREEGQQDSIRFARAYRKAGPIRFQSARENSRQR